MKNFSYFKHLYAAIFYCSVIMGTYYSYGSQSHTYDPASVQWDNREDVKKSAAQLKKAFDELEIFVQKISRRK